MAQNTSDRGAVIAVGTAILLGELSQVRAVGISACHETLVTGELDLVLVQPVSALDGAELLPFGGPRSLGGAAVDEVGTFEWIDANTVRLHNFDAAGDEDKSGVIDFLFYRFQLGAVPVT